MTTRDTSDSPPPRDRYCDLVMKGGITSGIVYPAAIDRLAKHYRFKSIGGTSAGAIAAAVTAAAEYQRRHTDSAAGFARLAELPKELGATAGQGRTSKLLSLFQPQPSTRRLFRVLVGALNSVTTIHRIWAVIRGLLSAYWLATISALLLALLTGLWAGWLAGVLTAVVATTAAVCVSVYRDLTRDVVANGFGLCTGLTVPNNTGDALTPWLHALIQEAAGRRPEDPPLTFGDLWDAPGFPPPWLPIPAGDTVRSIDLRMFSTNLTHGRPYIFPLHEGDASTSLRTRERLFFQPVELGRYLPPGVMTWMREHARPYRLDKGRQGHDPDEAEARDLLELPAQRNLPILLAARLSLSFPLLFSAIPLWAIDHDLTRAQRTFRRCWFSDGGISSNFPMHLFDGLIPMWPTFGITLEPKIPERDNMIFVPQAYREGYGERWHRFDEKPHGVSRFGGFLGSIVATMQNWNDNSLSRMPGVRDRVARVRLNPNEGGMNLNMEREIIDVISRRGAEAADGLLALFASPPRPGRLTNGWDDHRLVRLNVLLKMIEARAPAVVAALDGGNPHATDLGPLVLHAQSQAAPGYEQALSEDQAEVLRQLLAALRDCMAGVAPLTGANPFVSVPKPELRVRPPL